MSLETTINQLANAEREANGRFKPGNQGGPGNPNAGKAAQFRQMVMQSISAEDLHAVFRKLLEMARDGHWQAMKLFLLYTCGKPESSPPMLDDFPQASNPPSEFAPPLPNGEFEKFEYLEATSPNGEFENVEYVQAPSPNVECQAEPPSPNGDFSGLNRQQRRAQKKAERLAKRARNTPKPVTQMPPGALAK